MLDSELRERLSAIEPNETTFEGISELDLPALVELLGDDEPWLAARAVFAIAIVGGAEAISILNRATTSDREEVRVAIAASASRMAPEDADILLERLLDDPSVGVRRFAVESVSAGNGDHIRQRMRELARSDSDPYLRSVANERSAQL